MATDEKLIEAAANTARERDSLRAQLDAAHAEIKALREALHFALDHAEPNNCTYCEEYPPDELCPGHRALAPKAPAEPPSYSEPVCPKCLHRLLRGPIGGGHFDWLECNCAGRPCATCGGQGSLMDSGPPDHWRAPCTDCGGSGKGRP